MSETDITAGRLEVQPAKALSTLAEGDVLIGVVAGGAGFGDPLRREPHLIARDLARGLVSELAAQDIYGVVMVDGEPDLEATRELRSSIRDTRRREARRADGEHPVADGRVPGVALHPVSDAVGGGLRRGADPALRRLPLPL